MLSLPATSQAARCVLISGYALRGAAEMVVAGWAVGLLITSAQGSRIPHRNSPRPPIWDASALSLAVARQGARGISTEAYLLTPQGGMRRSDAEMRPKRGIAGGWQPMATSPQLCYTAARRQAWPSASFLQTPFARRMPPGRPASKRRADRRLSRPQRGQPPVNCALPSTKTPPPSPLLPANRSDRPIRERASGLSTRLVSCWCAAIRCAWVALMARGPTRILGSST